MSRIYKIESRSRPGYFRRGAGIFRAASWNKTGKIWDTLGKLRSLITTIINGGTSDQFEDWEIVEYEVREVARYRVDEIIRPELLTKLLSK